MSVSDFNTAQTLFWLVTRRWPDDSLLNNDSRSALALALKDFVDEPLTAIDSATTELEEALRKRTVVCTVAHDQSIEIRSGTGGDSPWGYYGRARQGSKKVQGLSFRVASIQKRWPAKHTGMPRRGPKAKFDADAFLKKALSRLQRKRGIGLRYTHSTFKAEMQEWCLEAWGTEPGQSWLKKHLALALQKYKATCSAAKVAN